MVNSRCYLLRCVWFSRTASNCSPAWENRHFPCIRKRITHEPRDWSAVLLNMKSSSKGELLMKQVQSPVVDSLEKILKILRSFNCDIGPK